MTKWRTHLHTELVLLYGLIPGIRHAGPPLSGLQLIPLVHAPLCKLNDYIIALVLDAVWRDAARALECDEHSSCRITPSHALHPVCLPCTVCMQTLPQSVPDEQMLAPAYVGNGARRSPEGPTVELSGMLIARAGLDFKRTRRPKYSSLHHARFQCLDAGHCAWLPTAGERFDACS